MPRLSPELKLATLIQGYLTSAASITWGIPAQTTLPIRVMDSGTKETVPMVIISAEESPTKAASGVRRTLTVMGTLYALLKNSDTDAPTDARSTDRPTTRAQAATWLQLIEDRLRDHDALDAYLASLSSDDLDGFTLLKITHLHQPRIEREKEGHFALTLACAIEIHLAWSRTV